MQSYNFALLSAASFSQFEGENTLLGYTFSNKIFKQAEI